MDWRESFQQIFSADSFDYSVVENFKGFCQTEGNMGRKGELAWPANPFAQTEPKAVTTSFSILNALQIIDFGPQDNINDWTKSFKISM